MKYELHDADDFRALSNDVRKRRELNKLPEMKTEHVVSGCGPGLSVAADTPQDGVRSKLNREVPALDTELWTWICRAHIHPRRTADDYRELGKLAQKIADRAHLLSGKV